jgi:glycosyltransferase involved in cell wall biosynthesis
MRVLFIVPYPTEGPSNRFRVEQYLPYLKERRIIYSVRPFYSSSIYRILYKKGNYLKKAFSILFFIFRRIYDVFSSKNYDVIFIHREAYPFSGYFIEWLFKLTGKKLIYDFDDSLFIKKPKKIKKTIGMSDYVICGNGFLRNYAVKYNKNVFVLPTCIDTQNYKPRQDKQDKDKVILGWIGTTFTAIYLNILKDIYKFLVSKYKNIEFRIIGGNFPNSNLPLVVKEWSLKTEISELQEFDIGIMPLFDDDWAKGKCAFKIIQYMAVGIPTVASGVGVNVEIVEDGKDGFLVNTQEDWINKLSLLIENKELRKNMGGLARKKIERLYSVEVYKQKYIEILEKVLCAKDGSRIS